ADHDKVDGGNGGPDFDGPEVGRHNFLTLTRQLAHTNDNKQRGIFQTDNKLVAQGRYKPPERHRAHHKGKNPPLRNTQGQTGFGQAFGHRQERAPDDFSNIGTGVDGNGRDGGGHGVNANFKQHRQREVNKHYLHDNGCAPHQFDINQRDAVNKTPAVGTHQAKQQPGDHTANQAGHCDVYGGFSPPHQGRHAVDDD